MRRGQLLPPDHPVPFTVGLPSQATHAHAQRVVNVLKQAGYRAAPTSDEAIRALANQIENNERGAV